ncbi:uncharacterized protein LOC135142907 [Zophobas morio]|uniref:uncharacterized protein LOC135142907 n=1 Tax=Zophobas morio TaxID=2755281 RepID=UPI0030837BAD
MSSVNEQLAPPPKPRLSPLEFRNTDLVSRLLAATPPYLYNMSLLPNTYFFSEMLRSFVQAKSDPSSRSFPTRRTRKRPWTAMKSDSSSPPKLDQTNDWALKNSYVEHKSESPLELTTESDKAKSTFSSTMTERKVEMPLPEQVEPLYSPMGQEGNPSGLILPPPPPMWYPPLYPTTTPYGIDPLHFFIDLRVSGHIYDRKNQRDEAAKVDSEEKKQTVGKEPVFKQSRHASAFSVPTPRLNRPMNLSHSEEYTDFTQESKNLKFDVKSMGLDRNKIGTSYIMTNINHIYKNVAEEGQHMVKNEGSSENGSTNENDNETEEEKQKRVKDLRALIGLELVVDYMNHAKPQPKRPLEETGFTDSESAESPTLEVVAVHDET